MFTYFIVWLESCHRYILSLSGTPSMEVHSCFWTGSLASVWASLCTPAVWPSQAVWCTSALCLLAMALEFGEDLLCLWLGPLKNTESCSEEFVHRFWTYKHKIHVHLVLSSDTWAIYEYTFYKCLARLLPAPLLPSVCCVCMPCASANCCPLWAQEVCMIWA